MNLSDIDLENLLKRHFHQDEFEPDQKEIITSVLSGRNVLAVIRRGFDQALCYKLPALVLDDLTVVVTRLHGIVREETDDFLPTTYINNSLSSEHLQNRLRAMVQGKYRMVYVEPELFKNRAFLFAASKVRISLLVVEDAHCISRWGYDFRPEYLEIGKAVLEMEPLPRVLALAEACTPRTQDDICYRLQIGDAKRLVLNLFQPDLSLKVISTLSTEEKLDILRSLVQKMPGAGIVYASSRRQVMEICEFLREFEPEVAAHHGGMGRGKRTQVEEAFDSGQLRILVATTTGSFSAGLDSARTGYIIHFDMPDCLERYCQQISTAGKDGEPARCILIYSPSDRDFHRSIIERNSMPPTEFWRMNDTLSRYAKESKHHTNREAQSLSSEASNGWLNDHFAQLPAEAQRNLNSLKSEYENLGGADRNPWSRDEYNEYLDNEHWREFSRRMLASYQQCQICGRRSEHIHHRHYSTLGRERPEDVVVLCIRCHCLIHPDSPMTGEMMDSVQASEEEQPKLFDTPKPKIEPTVPTDSLVVLPYGQIELEAAIDRHKLHTALREMEDAGMLDVLPDCSMQARVRILIPRDELTAHALGETGQLVVKWLLENTKSDPLGEIYVYFASLEEELYQRHDVLEDYFISLYYAGAISYMPSHPCTALRLGDLDASRMEDIFEEMKGRRYQALRDVEEYVHTRECRQSFLCGYLGGEMWQNCGKCDNCLSAESDDVEARSSVPLPQYARAAMELVNRAEGRLSKTELVRILAGMDQRTTRYDKWKEFGFLSIFAPEDVRRLLDLLIGHGFLKEEGEIHPPVDLTRKGFRALNGELDAYDEESIAVLAEDMRQIAQRIASSGDTGAWTEENRALIAILRCAKKTDGQVGRLGLAMILLGEKSRRLAKYGFDHIEEYGSLTGTSKEAILQNIDTMIERGCLSVSSFFFPMLQLTDTGLRKLEKMELKMLTY